MVKLNGEEKELAGKNLLEYLKAAGFKPEQVVVERNLEIVPKEQLGCVTIQDGDVIEVLHFVGGGCEGDGNAKKNAGTHFKGSTGPCV